MVFIANIPIEGLWCVITPFLPPGFSRVSTRKTRQPKPSRLDSTSAHHIRITSRRRSGTPFPKSDQIWPGLTKFDKVDQVWPEVTEVWPNRFWPDWGPLYPKTLKTWSRIHFPKSRELWPSLTKVNQVWPRFDQAVPDPTGVHYTQKTPKTWSGIHFPEFGELWPSLTEVWPDRWPDQKLDRTDHPLSNV